MEFCRLGVLLIMAGESIFLQSYYVLTVLEYYARETASQDEVSKNLLFHYLRA